MNRGTIFPPITLTEADYDRLTSLVRATERTMPDVANYLTEELARAAILPVAEIPPNVVAMRSIVTFRDEQTQESRTITLVFPGEENLAEGRLSVLTPVGAALIGLTEGQSISWYTRRGTAKVLTVLKVKSPQEAL